MLLQTFIIEYINLWSISKMPQSVVRNRTAGMHGGHSGCRQVTVPLPAQRRSAYGERNAAVPTGMALGDFYRLGNKVFKVVKKALIFGHSVAEQTP